MDRTNERRPSKLQTRGRGYDKNGTTIAWLLWEEKRFIRIIKELWNAKGYGDLGLSSLNLRDQAARLEIYRAVQRPRAQQFIEIVWDVVIKMYFTDLKTIFTQLKVFLLYFTNKTKIVIGLKSIWDLF